MDMSKMQAMMAQAKQMGEAADEQLSKVSVEGSAGGGAVRIRRSGKKEVLAVTLDLPPMTCRCSKTSSKPRATTPGGAQARPPAAAWPACSAVSACPKDFFKV
jgi:hypothetical protein